MRMRQRPRCHASSRCACISMIRSSTTVRCACCQARRRWACLSDDEIARLAGEVPPVACVAPAGAVVAMRPLIVHASSKVESDRPRRVLHIEYADALVFDGIELAVA
jgi:hypothetical protein